MKRSALVVTSSLICLIVFACNQPKEKSAPPIPNPTASDFQSGNGQNSDSTEIRTLERRVDSLTQQLEAKEKEVADRIKAEQKKIDPTNNYPSTPLPGGPTPAPQIQVGKSGQVYCGPEFYGTIFACGPQALQQCGKSDDTYKKVCEITGVSKPNTGGLYPICGSVYYGAKEKCGTKFCAKSDAQGRFICEI